MSNEKIRASLTPAKKRKIMESAKNACEMNKCKNKSYEVHHITRVADGGQNIGSNLIVLCANCHSDVGDGKIQQKQLRSIVSSRSKTQKSYIIKILQNVRPKKEKGFWDKASDWFNECDDDLK